LLGVDFNDRLLSFASDGSPGGSATPRLRVRPTGLAHAVPALVDSLREELGEGAVAPLWASVGAGSSGADLGELLRALRAARCEVQGFVDGAAVTVAWLRLPGHSIVLDLHQHWLDLSLVFNAGETVELRRTARVLVGNADLFDHWLRLAAQTLVQQTRFDPLHDQRHEQILRAGLTSLVTEAHREGQARMEFEVDGRQLELMLSRDQLRQAAIPWCAALSAALQPLCAATDDCHLVVPDTILEYPGIDEVLVAAHAGSLHALTEGVSARAASCLPATGAGSSGAVAYLTRVTGALPPATDDACRVVQHGERTIGTMATHVVYRGRAISIPAQGMVLGRTDNAGIRLPEGIAGLSRRHCTLQRAGGRTQIIDHSRYGSFIDGLRIHGRGYLPAGSVLRLGTPGIELPLIALDSTGET
jgi:FHA domain